MALSEHEQRLLEEMERRLYQSEADVMQAPSGGGRQFNLRSLVLGIVVGLLGVGVLIGGVAISQLWLGLIGFALMLGGTVLALSKSNGTGSATAPGPEGSSSGPRAERRSSLGERLEERWNERMDGER